MGLADDVHPVFPPPLLFSVFDYEKRFLGPFLAISWGNICESLIREVPFPRPLTSPFAGLRGKSSLTLFVWKLAFLAREGLSVPCLAGFSVRVLAVLPLLFSDASSPDLSSSDDRDGLIIFRTALSARVFLCPTPPLPSFPAIHPFNSVPLSLLFRFLRYHGTLTTGLPRRRPPNDIFFSTHFFVFAVDLLWRSWGPGPVFLFIFSPRAFFSVAPSFRPTSTHQ